MNGERIRQETGDKAVVVRVTAREAQVNLRAVMELCSRPGIPNVLRGIGYASVNR